jgi:hypothetical protein
MASAYLRWDAADASCFRQNFDEFAMMVRELRHASLRRLWCELRTTMRDSNRNAAH